MLRIARAVNPNRVSAAAWMLVLVWFGSTYPLCRLLGAHAEEDNTALAWLFDLCMPACMGMFATTSFGLRRAVAEEDHTLSYRLRATSIFDRCWPTGRCAWFDGERRTFALLVVGVAVGARFVLPPC